jgi:D-alanyl-D-alanine carboxypeptidase
MRCLSLSAVLAAAIILPASTLAATPTKDEVARYAQQQLIDSYAKSGPGAAVIVARGDQILFRGARGLGNVEQSTPLSAESLFDIGSITKQFASAGLLKLVETGKVSVDDSLSKYVKDFPNGDHISVLELLNHTSGVKNYSDMPDPSRNGLSTTQVIGTFKNAKPDFAPGTSWAYDNSGYVLIGAVIESASGKPWQDYLRQTLFEPLGLHHTGYGADPAVVAKAAHGYMLIDGNPKPAPLLSMSAPYADGALVSTVDDLLIWNRALHKGRVLRSDSYRQMITPVGKAAPEQYGFGLWHTTLRNREMIAHSGHISGFSAYLLYLPESDVSVAILQNMDRAPGVVDPTASARKLAAFTIGDPYPTPPAVSVDAAILREAEGIYGTDPPGPSFARIEGARIVRVINGVLTAAPTGGDRSDLIPIGVDIFLYGGTYDRLKVVRDGSGKATAVRFFPWGEGEGLELARTSGAFAAPVTLPGSALDRLVGTYFAEGMELQVMKDGSKLKGQLTGQPPVDLIAESANKFVVAPVDASVEFASSDGKAKTVTLYQGGDVIEFTRKP